MPVPTFPGVYVEEVSSGVRTITGVATSITAFVGRARRGPVNHPVTVNNFADFERGFGGLWSESTMSYAVRDFYLNGGSAAVIVRLLNPTEDGPNRVTLAGGGLSLEAKHEGAWALELRASPMLRMGSWPQRLPKIWRFNRIKSSISSLRITRRARARSSIT